MSIKIPTIRFVSPEELGPSCRELSDDDVRLLSEVGARLWPFASLADALGKYFRVSRKGVVCEEGEEVSDFIRECVDVSAVAPYVVITVSPGMIVNVASTMWHEIDIEFGRCEITEFRGNAVVGGRRVPFRSRALVYPRLSTSIFISSGKFTVCKEVKVPKKICLPRKESEEVWEGVISAFRDIMKMLRGVFDGSCCIKKGALLQLYP